MSEWTPITSESKYPEDGNPFLTCTACGYIALGVTSHDFYTAKWYALLPEFKDPYMKMVVELRIDPEVETEPCPKGHETKFSFKWDAAFCPSCNVWTDEGCGLGIPDCLICCKDRPKYPLSAITGDGKPSSIQESYDKLKDQPAVKALMRNLADR